MPLKRHSLIRKMVAAIASFILTGRLTRLLPIIRGAHGINGYFPRSPHTTGLRDSGAVKPHSRVPSGRECVERMSTSDYKLRMEGQFLPNLEGWGLLAQSR